MECPESEAMCEQHKKVEEPDLLPLLVESCNGGESHGPTLQGRCEDY